MSKIIVNPTKTLVVVPLVTAEGKTTSMYVQPQSRAEVPPGHEIKEPYQQQNPRISVVTV